MVYLGLWVYQMYHFAKLDQPEKFNKDQPKQQMEQKVSLPEESTKISIENEKLYVKKEIMDKTPTKVSPIEPTKESVESQTLSMADFDLIRCIGIGSYAKVLMVELKKTRRLYAMKVIKKELLTDNEEIDLLQTEKHVFQTVSNHPFLVGLHSCFQTPSRLFFVMELVQGGDLLFHMQRQRYLSEEHARFYSAEICLALNFLHTRGTYTTQQ